MQQQKKLNQQGPSHKSTILIVDDQPDNLELLVQILKDAGYDTRPTLNGQVALGAVEYTQPDLILLDIRMPDMDGFEVCKRLKALPQSRNIPVIFISALDDIDEKIKAFHSTNKGSFEVQSSIVRYLLRSSDVFRGFRRVS